MIMAASKYPVSLLLTLMLSLTLGACAQAQNVEAGRRAFQENCALCHDVSPAKINGPGPSLYGVVGRAMGTARDYEYSETLFTAGTKGQVWTEALIKAFITDPQKAMPGTYMAVALNEPKASGDIVAYLASLTGGSAQASAAAAARAGDHDWRKDAPGVAHHIKASDLPAPFTTASAGNPPSVLRDVTPTPRVPEGLSVSIFSRDANNPRALRTAPNGDMFVIETGKNRLSLYKNVGGSLKPERLTFAEGLDRPAGIAFYPNGVNPQYLYVVGGSTLVRIPYRNGDVMARAKPELLIDKLVTGGGHANRDVVFSPDNKTIYITVGSASNVQDGMSAEPAGGIAAWEKSHGIGATWGSEEWRAQVMRFTPDGKAKANFATGLRNCVALNIKPGTSDLYCVINERDGLGDNLVPDYFTRVQPGAFYGWPWYYLGDNLDPRHKGARPDLKGKVTVPEVLFVSHSAPLGFTFYQPVTGAKANLPANYTGDAFVALHGSWNRADRTGSKVVRVLFRDGKPTGAYEDFMTGLILDDRTVTARPVGVTVGPDGAVYVSDDAASYIWRIAPK
jgi:glucose/arabinose dehydrogenase